MVVILYKMYFNIALHLNLLTYRKLAAFSDFQYTPLCVIYKLVSPICPTRSKFTIHVGTFGPHNVINTRYTHTHIHIHRLYTTVQMFLVSKIFLKINFNFKLQF